MKDEDNKKQRRFRRSEAFFGRRKSKALSPAAQRRFEELYPKLGIDVSADRPENLNALYSGTCEKLVLEIGFGGGEHLIHQAVTNPATGFIGVEPFVNSMSKVLRAIETKGLQNIRLYNEDAVELLDWLPEGSVDRIDLLYPDPWPKQRHWKRRFVNQANLDRMARVLKPQGLFHFASDIDTYINWTLNHCHRHPAFNWQASNADDWHKPYDNWTRTRYEAKAIREDRIPCYLRFSRTPVV